MGRRREPVVVFRTTARDVNLFETDVDKYAAFHEMSFSVDNSAGVCLVFLYA